MELPGDKGMQPLCEVRGEALFGEGCAQACEEWRKHAPGGEKRKRKGLQQAGLLVLPRHKSGWAGGTGGKVGLAGGIRHQCTRCRFVLSQ